MCSGLKALPATDHDKIHWRSCAERLSGACLQCNMAAHKSAWGAKFLIAPKTPSSGTWLEGFYNSDIGRYAVRCKCCAAARVKSAWGKGDITRGNLTITSLYQHAQQVSHKAAVQEFLTGKPEVVSGVVPPSASVFAELLKQLRANRGYGKQGIAGVGKGNKIRRLKHCIAEGFRKLHRDFLRNAKTICIHQDGRKSQMVVRYRSCDDNMRVKFGCGVLSFYRAGCVSDACLRVRAHARVFFVSVVEKPTSQCCQAFFANCAK